MVNYRLTHFKGFKLDHHTKIYNLFLSGKQNREIFLKSFYARVHTLT